jgi:hypothetical protein
MGLANTSDTAPSTNTAATHLIRRERSSVRCPARLIRRSLSTVANLEG